MEGKGSGTAYGLRDAGKGVVVSVLLVRIDSEVDPLILYLDQMQKQKPRVGGWLWARDERRRRRCLMGWIMDGWMI